MLFGIFNFALDVFFFVLIAVAIFAVGSIILSILQFVGSIIFAILFGIINLFYDND